MQTIRFKDLVSFSEKQEQAHNELKTHSRLLYGGAMGGGKSYWLRWELLFQLLRFAKNGHNHVVVGLFCEDYPALKDRHLSKITKEIPGWVGTFHADHKEYGKSFILKPEYGAGVIAFRNLDDSSKYQSAEFAVIAVDELTKNEKETYDDLITRLRWAGISDTKFIAGTNPGGIGHCVPFGEVLTKNGWKDIKQIEIGEDILTLDKDNCLAYRSVEQKIKEKYRGRIIKSFNWSAKFECTPEHKIVRTTETKNKQGRIFHRPSFIKAKNIPKVTRLPEIGKWQGKEIKIFEVNNTEVRKKRIFQPLRIHGDNYCRLMGWFLSEGYFLRKQGLFGISQSKKDNKEKIRGLLEDCGFNFRECSTGFNIYSRSWMDYLSQFGKCRDKFVPLEIRNATSKQINLFLETAFAGDGCGNHYYTTSKQLADDMVELAIKVGKRPYLSSRKRKDRKGLSYDISFKPNKVGWIEKEKIKEYDFNGHVYCLGIDNLHRFYLRQNGTVWLSGNSWVKKWWIDRDFEEGIEADQFIYIPAKAEDNPYISPEYLKSLEGLPEDKRRAYRDGDWDIFKGQYFSEFRREIHVVRPFEIKGYHKKFICLDYGYAAPSAVYWCFKDYDGVLYIYKELYQTGLTYENLTKEIISMTNDWENISYMVADPAIWQKKGETELSGAEIMEQSFRDITGKTLILIKGNNDRINGWNILREYLKPFSRNEERIAKLQIFDNCHNLIRTLPSLIYDEHKAEDLDSDGEDHAADSLRYGIMSRPQKSPELNNSVAKLLSRKQTRHTNNLIDIE